MASFGCLGLGGAFLLGAAASGCNTLANKASSLHRAFAP